jgi:hypothetical protein
MILTGTVTPEQAGWIVNTPNPRWSIENLFGRGQHNLGMSQSPNLFERQFMAGVCWIISNAHSLHRIITQQDLGHAPAAGTSSLKLFAKDLRACIEEYFTLTPKERIEFLKD